eukprot:4999227-Alexandrium_andersonii.AAC.1
MHTVPPKAAGLLDRPICCQSTPGAAETARGLNLQHRSSRSAHDAPLGVLAQMATTTTKPIRLPKPRRTTHVRSKPGGEPGWTSPVVKDLLIA